MSRLIDNVAVSVKAPGQRYGNIERLFRGRITGTSGSNQTLYTAPSDTNVSGIKGQVVTLTSFWLANIDSADHTVTLYIVESGGSADDDRLLFKDVPIAANTVYHMNQVEELIDNGGTIQAYADSANKIVARLSGWVYR